MSHVLTVKIPDPLRDRLEEAAQVKGRSKGALVREALEKLLEKPLSQRKRVESITRTLAQNKKPRIKVDWSEIYRASATKEKISPEEEVLRARRRGL